MRPKSAVRTSERRWSSGGGPWKPRSTTPPWPGRTGWCFRPRLPALEKATRRRRWRGADARRWSRCADLHISPRHTRAHWSLGIPGDLSPYQECPRNSEGTLHNIEGVLGRFVLPRITQILAVGTSPPAAHFLFGCYGSIGCAPSFRVTRL